MSDDYHIRKDQRVFVVGMSGSGKTTLVKSLLWKRRNMIVCDPKRTFTVPAEWEHSIVSNLGALEHSFDRTQMIIYRPTYEELENKCNGMFEYVFDYQNVLLYVDEVTAVTTPRTISTGYGKCLKMGRELNISVWSATQRPANIPTEVMTEANHIFCFQLTNPIDRKRIADYTTPDIFKNNPTGHGFVYYNNDTSKYRYIKSFKIGRLQNG